MSDFNIELETIKEDQDETGPSELDLLINLLLQGRFVVHVFHLRTQGPGSYAAHLALGEIYEVLSDFADTLAEQYQGITQQLIQFPAEQSFIIPGEGGEIQYISEILSHIESFIDEFDDKDKTTSNILQDLSKTLRQLLYKLTFLK